MSASFNDLKINQVYNFNTTSPAFLGSQINRARLTSIMSADQARKKFDFDSQYRAIFPTLPNGTPNQPNNCIIYEFTAQNSSNNDISTIYMADQWIVESTIEVVTSVQIQITLTDVQTTDTSKLRNILTAVGFTNLAISIL